MTAKKRSAKKVSKKVSASVEAPERTITKKTTKKAAKKTAKKAAKQVAKATTTAKKSSVDKPPPFDGKTTPLKKPAVTHHALPSGQIVIQPIKTEKLLIPIVGTAPLITHRFSEKARRQMLDNMQGRKTQKEPKNPEKEFKDAAYRLDDGGYGIPAIAFKLATVGGARLYGKSVTMKSMIQTLFVWGEYSKIERKLMVRIDAPEPDMREDVVRVGNGGTDLRYRPFWEEWRATLEVSYVKSMITRDSLVSLIEAGGMTVGVCEWRIEKSGEFGTFIIDRSRQIEVVNEP